jgi:UDP-N-acetylglucosamine 2-epimerase (non-hydrolysing)
MKYLFFLGTRPEIIKFAPVILEMKKRGMDHIVVFSGQHKDYNMCLEFFDEFGLSEPDYRYKGEFEVQPVKIWLKKLLRKIKPDYLFVQGDTDSAFCGTLAGVETGVKVIHRESGVRSFDRRMQEEKNRIMIDKLATIHFVPTKEAMKNLKEENIKNNYLVGQTLVDGIKKMNISKTSFGPPFILFTFHRKENLTVNILSNVFGNLAKYKNAYAYFPCHPNTQNFILKNNIEVPENTRIAPPLDYSDLLFCIKHAKLVISDSGGISEESCILGTPCITLRKTTDRPECIRVGSNVLIDPSTEKWPKVKFKKKWKHPYGNNVAKKICDHLEKLS